MPSPTEGADGIYEGTGEGSGVPSPTEGADGVYEGAGEGSGAPSSVCLFQPISEGGGTLAIIFLFSKLNMFDPERFFSPYIICGDLADISVQIETLANT